jgi:Hemopexin
LITANVKGALRGEGRFEDKFYFFQGDKYWRYDLKKDYGEVNYPQPLSAWKLPGGFELGIDACLPGENQYSGKAYFFREGWYASYEWKNGRVSDKKPLYDWGRRPFPFPNGIDAALAGAGRYKGKAYFFKDDKYARYDWKEDKIDLVDQPVTRWKLEGGFASHMDASVTLFESKAVAYFFKGAEYVKYDWDAERPFKGYPLPIAAAWPTGCAVWATHSQFPSNVGPDARLSRGANRVDSYPYGTIGGQAGWQTSVRFTRVTELKDKLAKLKIPDFYGDDQAGEGYVPQGRITRLAICGHGMGGSIVINGEANPTNPDIREGAVTEMRMQQDKLLQNDLRRIAEMLAPQASVLLMGCEVGQTSIGGDFLVTLSDLMRDHTVTGLTSIGYAGGPESKRSDGYNEAGARDTTWMMQSDKQGNPEALWRDLKAWPWAWENSRHAKTALNGKIIRYPEDRTIGR